MGPYPPGPWQPPMMSEKRRYAGVDVDNLNCSLCEVKFTSREQLDHHLENPTHMEKAANVPIDEDESEDYVPVPLTADNISSVRTKTHPIHCPFCKVWFPTITVLKYYHRYIIIICCWRGLITVNNISSYRKQESLSCRNYFHLHTFCSFTFNLEVFNSTFVRKSRCVKNFP